MTSLASVTTVLVKVTKRVVVDPQCTGNAYTSQPVTFHDHVMCSDPFFKLIFKLRCFLQL